MGDRPEWFAPKLFGFGSGLPISWQGWLVLTAYLAIVVGGSLIFAHRLPALLGIVVPATALFMLVAARTTRGGWRWRWGDPPRD